MEVKLICWIFQIVGRATGYCYNIRLECSSGTFIDSREEGQQYPSGHSVQNAHHDLLISASRPNYSICNVSNVTES